MKLAAYLLTIPAGLALAATIVWTCLCRGWLVDTTAPL